MGIDDALAEAKRARDYLSHNNVSIGKLTHEAALLAVAVKAVDAHINAGLPWPEGECTPWDQGACQRDCVALAAEILDAYEHGLNGMVCFYAGQLVSAMN